LGGRALHGEGHGGAAGLPLLALCFASCSREGCCGWLSVVRERKETGGRRRREEKKKKKKKGKKKKYDFFSNLEIF
jgi:hypothetical protein